MRERLDNLLFAVLVVAAALLAAMLSTRFSVEFDFSHARRGSLTTQSVDLLRSLDAPVDVVSYASRGGELRGAIADFVARYRRVKPDVALRFVDPEADPGAMREQGVRIDGEIELRYRDRSERLKMLTEREFTNALLRLSRTQTRVAAFLIGDGERRPDGNANADLGQFGALLAQQGVRAMALALGAQASVPDNTDLLVIANPRVPLVGSVVQAVIDFIERGGNLLWLAEPGENANLGALADALSVRVLPGLAVDGAGAALGIGDPSFVAVTTYPPHAVTRGFDLITLLPQAAALGQLADPRWDVKPLLRTGAQSWTETGAMPKAGETSETIRFDADAGELRGPLDLGFALTRLSPSPAKREQRAVVIGDGDFLSNSFLGNGGNREFGQRLFNWLLQDDALIEIPDRGALDRELRLGQTGLGMLSFGLLVGLPALLLATGAAIRWRRRRR